MVRHLIGRPARAAALLLAAWLTGPGSVQAQASLDGVLLRGGGSSFAAPLFKSWIGSFHKEQPGIDVEYDSIGSGEGISRFMTGSLDFGGTDAPLSEAQVKQVEGGALQLPIAAGMIAICYNLPGVEGELRLPREVYAGIFDGTIREWNDQRIQAANPDLLLPNRSIAVVTRRDGSGTTFAFASHLQAIDPVWREQKRGVGTLVDWPGVAMSARGNEGVAARIKLAEYSVGYVEYGFARRLGLQMASLENKGGQFVRPDVAAGQAAVASGPGLGADELVPLITDPAGAASYPVVTLSWALVNQSYADRRKAAAVRAFIGWGLDAGQDSLEPLGYVRLPPALTAAARAALEAAQW
ncbi:MAG: phosphate ABC transporter substrate-binding protein PstS [Geminicoccaceae bacterium]